jgi:hypothetical protein
MLKDVPSEIFVSMVKGPSDCVEVDEEGAFLHPKRERRRLNMMR